jgi:hypothetical protein
LCTASTVAVPAKVNMNVPSASAVKAPVVTTPTALVPDRPAISTPSQARALPLVRLPGAQTVETLGRTGAVKVRPRKARFHRVELIRLLPPFLWLILS